MTDTSPDAGFELAPTGTRVAVGGKDELRHFLDTAILPLGLTRNPGDLQSTAHYIGNLAGRDISIRFSIRKRTHNIGAGGSGRMIDYRTFEGLSMAIEVSTEIPTRLTVGETVKNGLVQSLVSFFGARRGLKKLADPRPIFLDHEIWAADEGWAHAFLGNPKVISGLESLTAAEQELRSWSLVFIPGKMTLSRRLTTIANLTTDTIRGQLNRITELAALGEQSPVSRAVELTRYERRLADNPNAINWGGCVLILGLVTLPVLLLVSLAILLGS